MPPRGRGGRGRGRGRGRANADGSNDPSRLTLDDIGAALSGATPLIGDDVARASFDDALHAVLTLPRPTNRDDVTDAFTKLGELIRAAGDNLSLIHI